jgi:prepilin-type N-terminal cleavage/methylation domain-containing protein
MRVLARGVSRGDRGFGLVEIIVATTVMAVGILGAVEIVHSSFDVAGRTSDRARAVSVAVDHLETARSTPYEQLTVPGDPTAPPTKTTRTVGGSTFTVKRAVTWKTDGSEAQAYKKVSVWVEWKDGAGLHEVHQESYVYPAGSGTAPTTVVAGAQSPGAPTALLATLPTGVEGGVDLTWTPPAGGAKPARWVVQKSTDRFLSRIWDVTRTEPPESTSMRVPGLAAGTTYDFRVAAAGADGSMSAWSPIATATTAASLLVEPCRYRSLSVTPPALPRTVRGVASRLASTPTVTVETSGACSGLSITYRSLYDGTITVPLARNGSVWSGDVQNTPASRWEVGPTTIDLYDHSGTQKGSLTLTVCESGTTCS